MYKIDKTYSFKILFLQKLGYVLLLDLSINDELRYLHWIILLYIAAVTLTSGKYRNYILLHIAEHLDSNCGRVIK
jgi:hypothetical protein